MKDKKKELEQIKKQEQNWKDTELKKRTERFGLTKPPVKFFTPQTLENHDFLEKVGFPGQYPFTAGNNSFDYWKAFAPMAAKADYRADWGGSGVGRYGGFGTPGDYRDYLKRMHTLGRMGGPNIAFDLVTQCGYDSDSPLAEGEVGRVGVAMDSFRDFEIIYEPYTGEIEMDKVKSSSLQ